MHAHIVSTVMQRRKSSQKGKTRKEAAGCWRCSMAKAYTFISCIHTDYMQHVTLQELNTPHNAQRHDCKCFACFHTAVSKLIEQTKDALFDVNEAAAKLDEKMESFHVHEAHQREELAELRERVAALTLEQLVCEEKARDMVMRAEKKVVKPKKHQSRVQTPAAPVVPLASSVDKEDRKLVPVFGEPPVVSGGAFEALTDCEPDERHGFKFEAPRFSLFAHAPPLAFLPPPVSSNAPKTPPGLVQSSGNVFNFRPSVCFVNLPV